jgi:ABC-type glycerol-3-phosphate transport system permease component
MKQYNAIAAKYRRKGMDTMRQKGRLHRMKISDIVLTIVAGCVSLLCLLPLLYIVSLSLSDKAAAGAGLVKLLPVNFTLSSYTYLLQERGFYTAFWVSIKRVLIGCPINFILTVLMAYPLSKEAKEFRFRNVYIWVLMVAMMFNGGLIPWYMVVNSLNITNTIWALTLPMAVPVFNVILLMNFFRGLPKAIVEAGEIDGCGPWRMLFTIYLPLSVPALATVTLFSFISHWNAFFDGLILINTQSKIPLQTYIQQLVIPQPNNLTRPEDVINLLSQRTTNAAKIVVTMIPILLIYPFLQKYFIGGITLGSVKE